jgi:hypothetical protein
VVIPPVSKTLGAFSSSSYITLNKIPANITGQRHKNYVGFLRWNAVQLWALRVEEGMQVSY